MRKQSAIISSGKTIQVDGKHWSFIAGAAILMRFAAKFIHINMRGVHIRLDELLTVWNKERRNLNFEICFYSIHLISYTEQTIVFGFGDIAKISVMSAFLHSIKMKLLEHKLFLLTILIANHQLAYGI